MNDDVGGQAGGPDERQAREHEAHLGELADELRLLAEVVLERVEPVLRQAMGEDRPEWSGCGWCPVCAVSALARGEHNDMVTTFATYGAIIVTILREALAGVPVDPIHHPGAGTDTSGHGSGPAAGRQSADTSPGSESRSGAYEYTSPATSGRPEYVPIPVQIKG